MFTDMKKRSYTLKRRAESQEATRARIVDAVMRLHEELGPKYATVSAIADRAGVQRLTVYRHFPDDKTLFDACTSRWLELNPPPDPKEWIEIKNGEERCRAALYSLYSYYRSTRKMWTVSFRDEDEVPALKGPMRTFRKYLRGISNDILSGFGLKKPVPRQAVAAAGHGVQFQTWASLADAGLNTDQASSLVSMWVQMTVRTYSKTA